jgi:hypothetical protein
MACGQDPPVLGAAFVFSRTTETILAIPATGAQTLFGTVRARNKKSEAHMSEAEFERLLSAVSAAIAPHIEEAVLKDSSDFDDLLFVEPLQAANDNEVAWPLFPFPDGWNGAC